MLVFLGDDDNKRPTNGDDDDNKRPTDGDDDENRHPTNGDDDENRRSTNGEHAASASGSSLAFRSPPFCRCHQSARHFFARLEVGTVSLLGVPGDSRGVLCKLCWTKLGKFSVGYRVRNGFGLLFNSFSEAKRANRIGFRLGVLFVGDFWVSGNLAIFFLGLRFSFPGESAGFFGDYLNGLEKGNRLLAAVPIRFPVEAFE